MTVPSKHFFVSDWLKRLSFIVHHQLTLTKLERHIINPLSPNSDQDQFSPNNIHTLSRDKVMRINKMIT